MNKMLNIAAVLLSAMLLLSLCPMPYGYYTLVRFFAAVFFVCLSISCLKRNQEALAVLTGSLALLFQPFIKLTLGREMWRVIDVIVALALISLVIYNVTKKFRQ